MADLRPALRPVLSGVLRQLGGRPHGLVVQIMSARTGEGASSVARGLALLAAETAARGVWLVDLDLWANGQFDAFARAKLGQHVGIPGPAREASLGVAPFWRAAGSADLKHLVTLHRVGDTRLFVSRCRVESVRPGERLQIAQAPAYWSAARQAADLVVVDAPPVSRSKAGLATAAAADGVILVVDAENGDVGEATALRDEVAALGARLLGVFVNRARNDSALFPGLGG